MKKILWGVSGIGNGHANRQAPIIDKLAQTCQIMIFAYDDSYKVFSSLFGDRQNVTLVRIAVPFVVGSPTGLDFGATAIAPANQHVDFLDINSRAMDQASKELGKADLVISDYEPISAQYAYAYQIPLVTIDQQSKYLYADIPKSLSGFTFEDEIMRLHMFFPQVHTRIACSFFQIPQRHSDNPVLIFPSPIKEVIQKLNRVPDSETRTVLVYLSSAREFVQNPIEIIQVLKSASDTQFHLFVKKTELDLYQETPDNVTLYQHGDPEFLEIISRTNGIISTAGHMLLSEAMYLGIPVYAMPVSPFEQHMNAYVINKKNFGISHPNFSSGKLNEFLDKLSFYSQTIEDDREILVRGVGQDKIVEYLTEQILDNEQ